MRRFENQNAIITGGAEGIGKGVAERLGLEGCEVILFDNNRGLLDKTVNELENKKIKVCGYLVDISNEENVKRAIEEVEQNYDHIEIMVNCAGIVGPTNTKITSYSSDSFDLVYKVNLKGAFLMTKYIIPVMEKSNYGRILLMASIGGKEGNPSMCGYVATKSGIMGLVKGVGKEYATTGITINGLAPAVIKTSMNENTDPKQLEYMTAKIPMGRLGSIDEVASLIAWIVSGESSFNTGFTFDISGGRATY